MASTLFRVLTHIDLTKRGGDRLAKFINMIENGEAILTTKGAVKLDKTQRISQSPKPVTAKQLHVFMQAAGFSSTFTGVNDQQAKVTVTYPKDFYKTVEFGGKGVGTGTTAEAGALSALRSELQRAMKAEKLPYLPIRINGRTVKVVDVQNTPGTPKSDFHFIDVDGKECMWMSHKDGTTAKDFQQWGGLTELYDHFSGNKEIKKFIDDVKKASGGKLDGKHSYARKIKDKQIALAAVYGIDYGKAPGRQNVDILLQGPIKVVKKGRNFELTSNHTSYNGELPTGDYTATFFCRYVSDRSNFGVTSSRFMIATAVYRRAGTVDI